MASNSSLASSQLPSGLKRPAGTFACAQFSGLRRGTESSATQALFFQHTQAQLRVSSSSRRAPTRGVVAMAGSGKVVVFNFSPVSYFSCCVFHRRTAVALSFSRSLSQIFIRKLVSIFNMLSFFVFFELWSFFFTTL